MNRLWSRRRSARLVASLVLLVGSVMAAHAGVTYIEQEVTSPPIMGQAGGTSLHKIWLGDGKVRVENATDETVHIMRQDTGKFYLIDLGDKTYSEMTLEQIQAMAGMASAMLEQMGQGQKTAVEVTETGETAQVGPWKARKVSVRMTGPMPIDLDMWLSKDLPMDMGDWSELMRMAQMQGMLGKMMEAMAKLDGFPVRQQMKMTMMGQSFETTSEVKLAKPVEATPDLFEPPAGFQKTEAPEMPGMPPSR